MLGHKISAIVYDMNNSPAEKVFPYSSLYSLYWENSAGAFSSKSEIEERWARLSELELQIKIQTFLNLKIHKAEAWLTLFHF